MSVCNAIREYKRELAKLSSEAGGGFGPIFEIFFTIFEMFWRCFEIIAPIFEIVIQIFEIFVTIFEILEAGGVEFWANI